MPRNKRTIPIKLGKKLRNIRLDAGLKQYELRLIICPDIKPADRMSNSPIPDYEKGIRAPSLQELLRYAQFGEVSVDFLIDDKMDEYKPPQK